mmetsp:Transcript_23099/g.56129  ORF Transcript_23099/g.56129 Transcript_23099/m.56129 type:complete len:106 (+) Transcript_23099:1230-1547(+)
MIAGRVCSLVFLFEFVNAERHQLVREVLTPQVGVASSCFDLEYTVLDFQQRHIEGSPTHVIDKDVGRGSMFLVQAVRQRCGSGLIDDSQNIEAADLASILRGLSL